MPTVTDDLVEDFNCDAVSRRYLDAVTDRCLSIEPTCLWRMSAAKVVEELFRVTPETAWDELLDLRGLLIRGTDWEEVLECFLDCRRKLEEDHYLPFYRLRKILASHLQLEHDGASLETLLRQRNFSFRKWQRKALMKGKTARLMEDVSSAAAHL